MGMRSSLLAASPLCIPATARAIDTASVTTESNAPPVRFAAEEVRCALKQAGWTMGNGESRSNLVVELLGPDGRGEAESFEITTSTLDGTTTVQVRGKDTRGVMYGGLDVAEQIAMAQGPVEIRPRRGRPFLPVRALEFNVPLAGNTYPSAVAAPAPRPPSAS